MTVRSHFMLAAAAGLWISSSLPATEPARVADKGKAPAPVAEPSVNQKTAEAIAGQLRQSAWLFGLKIDVVFQNGIADVSGMVADPSQKAEAIRIVRGVPGVQQVRDQLAVMQSIQQVQAAMPPVADPVPLPRRTGPEAGVAAPPGMGYPGPVEPVPIFQAAAGPNGPPYSLTPPVMPPYAWPTYAPYNNLSRVAYPTAYPYTSWPFIGPPYPFPKVPLGWRSVKLEWVDGHWWFGKTAQCHDWWRLRYW
ncbi:MAG: BON domain-containing protein [Gemmataceae bacterium]|nr:BON domain-containing protein [Gemmataceae bacterium]